MLSVKVKTEEGKDLSGAIDEGDRLIATAQRDDTLKQFIKWGDEVCMEHGMKKRRRCDKCWQALSRIE